LLGQGSYKQVYKGYDTESGREIAWNSISLNNISLKERSKILEEVSLCQKLKHKNLLHFITAWGNPENNELVMITEITGGSLKQYLRRIGQPKLKVIKNWAIEILTGLDYLHS